MRIHNDRGVEPEGVPTAHIHTVEVESQHDARCETPKWTHEVPHQFKGRCLVQVFDQAGRFVPLPSSGRTWKQTPTSVLIPVLAVNDYPIVVVMVGRYWIDACYSGLDAGH